MKTTDVILICEALNIQVTLAFGSVVGKKKIFIQNPYKSEPLSSSPITFLPTTAAKNWNVSRLFAGYFEFTQKLPKKFSTVWLPLIPE